MKGINIPLAGKSVFKLEGFPVPEVKSFAVNPHDTSGREKLLMGSGSYEEFGPGDGDLTLALPKASLIPWALFNGQTPLDNVVASIESMSGTGPAFDLEGFQVINPGGPAQGESGATTRTIKISYTNMSER